MNSEVRNYFFYSSELEETPIPPISQQLVSENDIDLVSENDVLLFSSP
jgi:hypothetical protein